MGYFGARTVHVMDRLAIFVLAWISCASVYAEPLPSPLAPEMIVVPGGTFEMGGDQDAWSVPDEHGNRTIDLTSFAVSRTEVTQAQYDMCVQAGSCRASLTTASTGEEPVTGVSWRDAVVYAKWLSAQSKRNYRLLSEAEWERVARAGTHSRFWWGDTAERAYGNFGDETCCRGGVEGRDVFEGVAPVGSFEATPEGVSDLYGNVWEWVQDCYDFYAAAPSDGVAHDPEGCRVRVVRGGSYRLPSGFARASARYRLTPGARRPDVGFRIAEDIGKQ
ncbi:formylglycine-generating enzyme family protein [Pseudooceanicola sp. LIPI14-2-Ac024]|uniref:formylglycine-generating enzyme family protein n=1 Tax=Pseudooceanicola sp. LIPI14-2-Ac024 TaxID=3344875 RepID=UPI0035D0B0DF